MKAGGEGDACANLAHLRTVGVLGSTEVMMLFMPVLCSTLGLCWMVSWVRGEMGALPLATRMET